MQRETHHTTKRMTTDDHSLFWTARRIVLHRTLNTRSNLEPPKDWENQWHQKYTTDLRRKSSKALCKTKTIQRNVIKPGHEHHHNIRRPGPPKKTQHNDSKKWPHTSPQHAPPRIRKSRKNILWNQWNATRNSPHDQADDHRWPQPFLNGKAYSASPNS